MAAPSPVLSDAARRAAWDRLWARLLAPVAPVAPTLASKPSSHPDGDDRGRRDVPTDEAA